MDAFAHSWEALRTPGRATSFFENHGNRPCEATARIESPLTTRALPRSPRRARPAPSHPTPADCDGPAQVRRTGSKLLASRKTSVLPHHCGKAIARDHPLRPDCDLPRFSEFPRGRGRVARSAGRFFPCGGMYASLISTSGSPRCNRASAVGKCLVKIARNRVFEVFPHVIHRTCGGGPSRSTSNRKSSSLLMTTTPALRAALKMTGSGAWRSPKSRTAWASM